MLSVAVSPLAAAARNGAASFGASAATGRSNSLRSAGAFRAMASPVGPVVTSTTASPRAAFTRCSTAPNAVDHRACGRTSSAMPPSRSPPCSGPMIPPTGVGVTMAWGMTLALAWPDVRVASPS